ncbi:phenylacetic acid degradation bifunctional protein PaaZ [Rhodovulum sp. DZ06]|uniref:phenylacetic acid degradation bifunctional protein PaaZ n=1 Tax=Rhodovulum sp. DZ06 TaxID=3425126 RepID=UPI003D33EA17
MSLIDVRSFACGDWVAPSSPRLIRSAVDGTPVAQAGADALDFAAMTRWAREVGGGSLRGTTFHDRAKMLKALGGYLTERKAALHALSLHTGATPRDGMIDIEGGIGTLFVHASKARKELPDAKVALDGGFDSLGRTGAFGGRHIYSPMQGVFVQINAFNFPVWGMLEKLAPAILAGLPCIVKPATDTCYVTEACVAMILEAGILPEGALQLVAGSAGDLLDHLGPQDTVSFTGSAATGAMLRSHPNIVRNAVRFSAEQDSLNAAILGSDAAPGTPEWDMFLREAVTEITAKAGQKCTAMRRLIVPQALVADLSEALSDKLSKVVVGDPSVEGVRMGALVSLRQREDVAAAAAKIGADAKVIRGGWDGIEFHGDRENGAFHPPTLMLCEDPDAATAVHEIEAFGPVSTILSARDAAHAAALANRGGGSLVGSVFTNDPDFARDVTLEAAAWHGRIYIADRDAGREATGHGAPVPHMVHGGPGRAGGGEEGGGVRAVLHLMQRSAIQGSPRMLQAVTGRWDVGAPMPKAEVHPFRKRFGELEIGETLTSAEREVTLSDIEHFAEFTGDTFYAHMDEEAAAANPFFPGRVAHGYLLLSFAAGLFVDPAPGPVLANTGLDGLRFMKPVSPGTVIHVTLTVADKKARNAEYGEVRWAVSILDAEGDVCAAYELLTMCAM